MFEQQQAAAILRVGQIDRPHQLVVRRNGMVSKIRLQEIQQAGHGVLSKNESCLRIF
ncbi:hypothetical protein LP419_25830 [Massilia sp. H-1]|nr:hypothetical protein LP419_25830 [Massilia sp. H-1]